MELEKAAILFAQDGTSTKAAKFDVRYLATFITNEYLKLTEDKNIQPGCFIRSITSCRLDLIRWGCTSKENKPRSYDEGHERDDVVEYRTTFVNDFFENKSLYYTVLEKNEHDKFIADSKNMLEILNQKFEKFNLDLNWKIPIRKENTNSLCNEKQDFSRRILLSHDESVYLST